MRSASRVASSQDNQKAYANVANHSSFSRRAHVQRRGRSMARSLLQSRPVVSLCHRRAYATATAQASSVVRITSLVSSYHSAHRIRHCTAMSVDKHYVDSHGQSEGSFGFCRLLGYHLLPRLKPIHRQKLYLPTREHADHYPHLQHILTRPINWALIRQQYGEMVKYASALHQGTAEAEAILARFTRNAGHPTYKSTAEVGRVEKTIFLCHYLHSEALRREINEGLNVVENWNRANGLNHF